MGMGLNLSGADTATFDVLPAGTYNAVIEAAEMQETSGEGKLPAGVPMVNVEFKVTDDEELTVENPDNPDQPKIIKTLNRRAWRRYIIAPDKIGNKPYEHKAKMDGILVRFLEAIGYSKDEIMSGDFNLDVDDLPGRECRVTLAKREYEGTWTNDVKGVKPPSSSSDGLL